MIALALILATVTGNPPPTSYTCNGSTLVYTIPWPYLSPNDINVTLTSAAGVTTTLTLPSGYSVKPSAAPSTGTLTLSAACSSGVTLTVTRSMALTQPQSFRTGAYQGAPHEQAFDRLEMQVQQNAATHATDKTAQTVKDAAQDLSISGISNSVAALNSSSQAVTSASSVLAFGSTTPRTLTTRFADNANVRDFGAIGNGSTNDTAAITAAYNSVTNGTVIVPAGNYQTTAINMKTKLTYEGAGVEVTTFAMGTNLGTMITSPGGGGSYMGIKRLTVRGTAGLAGQTLFDVTNVFASYFNEVFFSSAENLVRISSVEGQTIFRDCYFTGAGANGYALRLDNVQDITILNSPIENSAAGVYATRTNAVIRLKFEDIHSENVGRIFNIDTGTNNGFVLFRDIATFNTGANLADATTGYAFRVNNEYAVFDNIHVQTVNTLTPVITTPNWAIYARDCPSFTAADATTCYIPHFEIGYGSAYIPNSKRSLLDPTETLATLYTAASGATVSTAGGYGAFSGLGQYRIQPITGPTLSPTLIANKAVMVRFEYRSTTAGTYNLNGGVGAQITGYSGSTVTRSNNTIQLASTAGVWTKAYLYVRFTGEFVPGSSFFFVNSTAVGDTMDIRAFDIFEVNRPPYSLMDW